MSLSDKEFTHIDRKNIKAPAPCWLTSVACATLLYDHNQPSLTALLTSEFARQVLFNLRASEHASFFAWNALSSFSWHPALPPRPGLNATPQGGLSVWHLSDLNKYLLKE